MSQVSGNRLSFRRLDSGSQPSPMRLVRATHCSCDANITEKRHFCLFSQRIFTNFREKKKKPKSVIFSTRNVRLGIRTCPILPNPYLILTWLNSSRQFRDFINGRIRERNSVAIIWPYVPMKLLPVSGHCIYYYFYFLLKFEKSLDRQKCLSVDAVVHPVVNSTFQWPFQLPLSWTAPITPVPSPSTSLPSL